MKKTMILLILFLLLPLSISAQSAGGHITRKKTSTTTSAPKKTTTTPKKTTSTAKSHSFGKPRRGSQADVPSLEDIVAKAKAEGANWSVDQWKDASKSVMINIAPMLKAILEMTEKMEKNPDNVVSILAEMEKKQKEFEGLETLLNEFEQLAEATENGKKVMYDEAWEKEIKAELGLPDDF